MDRLVTAIVTMFIVSVTAASWTLIVQGATWLISD
jgi:hypothetical protein